MHESGEVVHRYHFGPFGNIEAAKGKTDNHYGFTGKEQDKTGLHYFAARYYDSRIGRFITPDPSQGYLQTLQSQHSYAYCHNNPVNYVDPSGLLSIIGDNWRRGYASSPETPRDDNSWYLDWRAQTEMEYAGWIAQTEMEYAEMEAGRDTPTSSPTYQNLSSTFTYKGIQVTVAVITTATGETYISLGGGLGWSLPPYIGVSMMSGWSPVVTGAQFWSQVGAGFGVTRGFSFRSRTWYSEVGPFFVMGGEVGGSYIWRIGP